MGRKQQFEREEVLRRALRVFWQKGYAETSVRDLELATGVNKSGLYSEFRDKLDLFLEALRWYLQNRGAKKLLTRNPLGFENIKDFLEIGETCMEDCRGCFAINSLREIAILPPEAQQIIAAKQEQLKKLIAKNLKAAGTSADANALAELTLTIFSGLCIEQNLPERPTVTKRKVSQFMNLLRSL